MKKVVKKGKLYDLKYDDGDKEQKVPAELIRLKVQYTVGDTVLAQPRKQTAWKRASVTSIGDDIDAACGVQYADGSKESLLPGRIKSLAGGDDDNDDVAEDPSLNQTTTSTIGDATDASSVSSSDEESPRRAAAAAAKPGSTPKQTSSSGAHQQRKKNSDATKAIEKALGASPVSEDDDASTDENARGSTTAAGDGKSKPSGGAKFALGDAVLALFEKGTKWYTGKIKGVIGGEGGEGTATYDVAYDDGDTEEGVAEDLIRPVVKYKVGDVIEAQYDAGTVWYKGRVVGVSDTYDDSYSVLYDDGDREDDLEHVLMRPFRPAGDRGGGSATKSSTGADPPAVVMAEGQAVGEEENWATPKSLPPAVLKTVRKALSAILGDMDKKGEQLSIRTARTRLEERFGKDLNSGTWKAWVKSTSEAIMEKWDEEEAEADRSLSSSSGGEQSKDKESSGGSNTEKEFDTPATTSKKALNRVREVTEEIMEVMDEKDEKMKASTIQHRVSDKLGERKVDSPHWTKWFKSECQKILDRWDEEESDSGSDSASEEEKGAAAGGGGGQGAFPSTAAFPKMSKAELATVRKSVGKVLNSMNDKQEPLSLKVMRQRVEQQLNTKFEGSQWKGWFKDEAQVVIDSWPDSDQEQDGGDGPTTTAASPKKPKYVSLSSMGDDQLDNIEEAAERILEEIDESESVTLERVARVATTVRERVEQEMGLDLGDREWRNWFKTLCKDIVEEWDADDDDGGD